MEALWLKKGKKVKGMIILALVGSLIIITACASSASIIVEGFKSDDDTIRLNLAHFFPGTHPVETKFIQGWIQKIDEATDGMVQITSYPGETLLKAPDVYNGVVNNVSDIGLSCFTYTRGRFPVMEAFELPGVVYKNSKVASSVAWEGIQKLDPEELEDTKVMMVIASGPGDLFTRTPVNTLEDVQGLEIRATGISADTLGLLGATPVAMAQSETYESLSKGVVNGNLSPAEVLMGWNHAEVTNYLTRTPFLYNTLFYVTMNLEKWNSIPEDIQDIIIDVTEEHQKEVGIGLWDYQNEPALKWAVEEMDMELIDLDEGETQRWIDVVSGLHDEYIIEANERDIDGEKVIETIKDLADKYNDIY